MHFQPCGTRTASSTMLMISAVLLCFCPQQGLAKVWKSDATTIQFKHWYPQFGYVFKDILATDCKEQYANYLTAVKDDKKIDWLGGGDHPSALTQPVIQCLLDNTTDYIKSAMSSAQVLLGVTPTILAILGSSYTELALLNIVAKRPLLSYLLALGSPSVYMSRAFEHTDPATLLQDRRGRLRQKAWKGWKQRLLTAAEYLIALAAITNIATMNWHLGLRTVCSIWSDNVIAPMLWSTLTVIAHVLGSILLGLQIKRIDLSKMPCIETAGRSTGIPEQLARKLCGILRRWTQTEFQSSCCQRSIHVTAFRERLIVIIFSWILSTLIVAHVIFGTIVYSSLYFIGPRDALVVTTRFMASVLACRIVCMFEIAGLRENIKEIILECDIPEERLRYWPMAARLGIRQREKHDVVTSVNEGV